jgi:transposase
MSQASLDQELGTLLQMYEATLRDWGAIPEEILYNQLKTAWLGTGARGEVIWNPVFWDFGRYWGFEPQPCRPYRMQLKGKIESGVKYIRRNFPGCCWAWEPTSMADFNA